MKKAGCEISIPATDGYPLKASLYEPGRNGSSLGVVIVNSAMAVRRGFYSPFASFLRDQGFIVITYDYRGIGGSRPATLRGFPARLSDWGERDFAGIVGWAASSYTGMGLSVVGHSTGGGIIGLAENNTKIHSIILVSAQNGHWRLWPSPARYRLAFLFYCLVPGIAHSLGYVPGWMGLGEDLPKGVALEWASWCRREGYMVGGDGARRREGFDRLRVPILAYGFADDPYAPRPAVEAFLDLLGSGQKIHRHIGPEEIGGRPIGHFGFFREDRRDTIWTEAAHWLLSHSRDPNT